MPRDQINPPPEISGLRDTEAASPVQPSGPVQAEQASEATNQPPGITADFVSLTSEAQNELNKNKALTPEELEKQKEAQQKLAELVEKLNAALAKGDKQEAASIMQEISALTGSSETELPSVGKRDVPGGNIPGAYGDAPVFYPVGGSGRSYDGGAGLAPADLSGVRATLPGDGNQGVVNTSLDIASKGYPYVWGGDGPQEGGYDCSGFSKAVYAKNGINIPRTAQAQFDHCKNQGTLFTDIKGAKPGDLIFFNNPYPKKTTPVGHVMVYLGNGKMAGAQNDGVKVYNVSGLSKYIVGFGRPR